MTATLDHAQRIHFRDRFRDARAIASKDAEGFPAVLNVLEDFGAFLLDYRHGLGRYRGKVVPFAEQSALATKIPEKNKAFHVTFESLYDLVSDARNDYVHQGACARHVTEHAVQVALVLEDALMKDAHQIRDFMVPGAVRVEAWQPLSFARQKMLLNSFSFLPIHFEGKWQLVSDRAIAGYVRATGQKRDAVLSKTIEEAIREDGLDLMPAKTCEPDASVVSVIEAMDDDAPFLIVDPDRPRELVGIVTAYDLL